MRAPGSAVTPHVHAATKRDALLAVCSLAPRLATERACAWCAAELPPGRRSWCSDRCGDQFWANHWWSVARTAAKRRDRYRCKRCGTRGPKRPAASAHGTRKAYLAALRAYRAEKKVARLEVNHIDPCAGRHKQLSCVHHLDNLETLCLSCHKEHTAALRARRASADDAPAAAGSAKRRLPEPAVAVVSATRAKPRAGAKRPAPRRKVGTLSA